MTSFSSVNVPGSQKYRAYWQRQHIIPTELINSDLSDFFNNLEAYAASNSAYDKYDNNDFDFNGILLPSQGEDALASGFTMHRGSHPKYTEFVGRIVQGVALEVEEAIVNGTAVAQAYQDALKTIRGIQAFLMDGHVASVITNELTGEPNARPLFMLNRKDPWLPSDSNSALDHALSDTYDQISLSSIRLTSVFWQGYDGSFTGFGDRSGTIFDPYLKDNAGNYISIIDRVKMRLGGAGTLPPSHGQFDNLNLEQVFSDLGDSYRTDTAVLNGVTYYFSGADPAQTIGQITSTISAALEIPETARANTLVLKGYYGPVEASFAYGPTGNGFVVKPPTETSLATFLDITDELTATLPGWTLPEQVRDAIDTLTDGAAHIISQITSVSLENLGLEIPQFTVANNGIAGRGHDGLDLMLGFGTAELHGEGGNDWIAHFGSGEVHGGAGDDKIFGLNSVYNGPSDRLDLYGGDGNDFIALVFGAGGFANGGAGDDILHGGGREAHLWGGTGADTFSIGAGTHIEDAEGHDNTTMFGIPLYGGAKQSWMEGGTAYWAPFSTVMAGFPVIGSSILTAAAFFVDAVTMKFASYQVDQNGDLQIEIGWGLGGRAVLHDYALDLDSGIGKGGISVFQHEWAANASFANLRQYVNLALKAGFGVGLGGFDPLVLDLDGDGYELTTEANSRAYFEFDSDGFGERTGWVRGDDGLLALDANANGKIDDVTELFGNRTTSGFTALAAHDANADGKIDASDAVYASLRVWQDHNQDGVSDAGELKSLAELGIASISLASTEPGEPTAVGGNAIVRTGNFTRTDGTTGGVADVAFEVSETATKWLGDSTVSSAAAALPQLKGFGELKDLRVAMTGDPALEAAVGSFAGLTTNDLDQLKAGAEALLYKWAGVEGVAAAAIGSNGFDARKLAFLEKYSGHQLMPRDGNGDLETTNLAEMDALWADQLTRLSLRLIVQNPMANVFSGITYREDLDLLVAESATALADLYAALLEDLPGDPAAALAQWQAWAPLLGAMADGMLRSDANIVRTDYIAAQLLRAMDGVAQPLDFATLAGALGVENLRLGTASAETLARDGAAGTAIFVGHGGSDTLMGGAGQDVYVFGRTIGNVTINDEEANPTGDRIRFAFLSASDVKLERSGHDLLITVAATGETIRVTGQFAPVTPLSSDVLLSTNKGVEEIQFADGTIFEIPEIMTAVGKGTDGNDHLTGTMHSDVLQGGLGDDVLEGGDDADLYVVNAGEGNDIIRDIQSTVLLRAADLVVFGDEIAPEDLIFARSGADGDDLLVTIGSGGQSLLIEGQFAYGVLGYNDRFALNSRIEAFAFRDYGDGWSHKDLQQLLIAQSTTAGNDETMGFGDDDTLGASTGDDLLIGMDGADTYHWGAGVGNDRIDERARYIDVTVGLGGISLTARADTVVFDSTIDPSSLIFARPYDSLDLVITNSLTGETLTVIGQFDSFQTGVLGAQWFDRVEWFQFADGSRISWQDVIARVTTGGTGNDRLRGDILVDRMIGGQGDDLLSGGGGGDTYVFNIGDGHDTLFDDNQTIIGEGFLTPDQTIDILEFGEGINPGDIVFSRSGSSITMTVGSSGDAVTLAGQDDYIQTGVFGAIATNRIEQVKFHDGTIWSWQHVNQLMIAAQTTAGNDVTEGFTLADHFEKSSGDDVLRGGDSGDTYVFGVGAGHDRIEESVTNVLYGDEDVVEFDATVAVADVSVSRDGNDLILTLTSGDSLRIAGEFDLQTLYTWTDIELFRFADGTLWTKADIQERLLQGTAGSDHLIGFHTADVLDGGAGNDILEGRDGSDLYRFDRGGGDDEIRETVTEVNVGDFDTLAFGPTLLPEDLAVSREGNDLVFTVIDTGETLRVAGQFNFGSWFSWNDVELFTFANGTQWTDVEVAARLTGGTPGDDHLIGTFRSDTLDGGAGNDLLEGGDGSDIYIFGLGYGQDIIHEGLTDANLGEDDEVRFGAGISLADLTFSRSGNTLVIGVAGTTDTLTIVDQFAYSTPYTWNDVERFSFADGSYITKQYISQLVLTGTAGNDHIIGFGSNDTLDGGAGDDILEGMDGSDTYRFGFGDGQDTVYEILDDGRSSEDDTLAFKDGVLPEDVTVTRDGQDAIFTLASGDSIRIVGHFNEGYNEFLSFNDIERATFADGTVWDKIEIDRRSIHATAGDDVMLGSRYAQTYDGGAGNDTISGGNNNDVLIGGLGNDLLQGDGGDDIYRYNLGDGDDVIFDYNYGNDGADRIVFGVGIAPADLRFANNPSDGSEIIVSFASSSGSIRIRNQWWGDAGIEFLEFADGTVWDQNQIAAAWTAGQSSVGDDLIFGSGNADVLSGGAGNDHILASGGDDAIDGGTGDDLLEGGGGNDLYHYRLGDGDDVIHDYNWNNDQADRIAFGPGISADDLILSRGPGASDLRISFKYFGGSILVQNQTWSDAGIEFIDFADGTSWSLSDINQRISRATAGTDQLQAAPQGEEIWALEGDDRLVGSAATDALHGQQGNDLIEGGGGTDLVDGGDGDDRLYGDYLSPTERVAIGSNLLVNGSFEEATVITGSGGWGRAVSQMPGWTRANAQSVEQVYSGFAGIYATDGDFWLDTDAGGGAGSNVDISQTVGGLAAGAELQLMLDHKNSPGSTSGTFQVYWNGTLVASFNDTSTVMRTSTLNLTAVAGDNVLRIVGTGAEDSSGAAIDNLRLYATAPLQSVVGNDIINGGAGADLLVGGGGDDQLDGGSGDDILYGDEDPLTNRIISGPSLLVNGSFETSGTIVAGGSWGYANSTLPGWTKANSQPFEQVVPWGGVYPSDGSFWLDMDSAGGAGSNMDISQTVNGLTAGELFVLQFDHANGTSAQSGSFEVYWNDELIASISESGTAMRTKTFDVVAKEGANVLRFKALGAEDSGGAALDNVRLFATTQVITGGGDDLLRGGAGNDQIHGGDGHDVALFTGVFGDYSITANNDGSYSIEDLVAGRDGADLIRDVEVIRFADGDYDLVNGGAFQSAQAYSLELQEPRGDHAEKPVFWREVTPISLRRADVERWVTFPDGSRHTMKPILELPRLIVPIDELRDSFTHDLDVKAAALTLVQSIAAASPTVAADALTDHLHPSERRDLILSHSRLEPHFASI